MFLDKLGNSSKSLCYQPHLQKSVLLLCIGTMRCPLQGCSPGATLERTNALNTEIVTGSSTERANYKEDLYWEGIQKCTKTIAGTPVSVDTDSMYYTTYCKTRVALVVTGRELVKKCLPSLVLEELPQTACSQDCSSNRRQTLNENKIKFLAEVICDKTVCTIQRRWGLNTLLITMNVIVHSGYRRDVTAETCLGLEVFCN